MGGDNVSQDQTSIICIDLKSFYASVECVERGLNPFKTNLVVADPTRSKSTICLAITPAMKSLGIKNRCRIHEIPDCVKYITAMPRMQLYMDYSAKIYGIYLRYVSKEDIHVYSVDECFIDVTNYLQLYHLTAKEMAVKLMQEVMEETGITARVERQHIQYDPEFIGSDSLRMQENRKEEKRLRKKKNKKTVADTGYKKVDRKEKKKKEKQEEKRRQKKLSVQQSIAYKEMGKDGICRVQGKTYSKCIRFYDINYQLAQNEDKNAIFENWCDFLNYFDASIHFQLSFINHKSSMKEFEQVIRIRPQDDAFDDVRMEYTKMLKQQLAKGNNGLVKSKYITFSIEADNIREAKPKLERIESDILNNFKILGVPAYPLNGVERLQILYETFNPDIMTDFQFDYGSMIRTGLNTKDYVAPTSFVFRDRNTFQMGNTIGAVSYLQILAPELTDKMLAEFLDIDKNLIVNLHVQSVDQMKAIKLVKSKVTDINRMKIEEQKKAVRAGYDMDIIPSDLNTYGGEAKRLLEDLQSRNERMFLVTALFLNTAKTKQALDNAIFQTAGIAQKYNCVLKRLDYQQEEGLMSSVPLGVNHIPIRRALTTTSTAIFVPFTTQELFMTGESLYYGLNALSNNMIMVDRKKLKNPNGLILGTPGSGKSFAAKREITNAFFVTKDDIIIGDPEGEYYPLVHALGGQVVHISPTSKDYINPMDINMDYSDDDNPLGVKSDFVLSLCELIMGSRDGIEAEEKSVIDRCLPLVYQKYFADPKPENMPVLGDLYDCLRKQKEPQAQRIATALEIYVNGSLKVFNHRTNVELNNRIVCFDIKELGKQLKKIGMLIVQDVRFVSC